MEIKTNLNLSANIMNGDEVVGTMSATVNGTERSFNVSASLYPVGGEIIVGVIQEQLTDFITYVRGAAGRAGINEFGEEQ